MPLECTFLWSDMYQVTYLGQWDVHQITYKIQVMAQPGYFPARSFHCVPNTCYKWRYIGSFLYSSSLLKYEKRVTHRGWCHIILTIKHLPFVQWNSIQQKSTLSEVSSLCDPVSSSNDLDPWLIPVTFASDLGVWPLESPSSTSSSCWWKVRLISWHKSSF